MKAQKINGSNGNREVNDFYPTPEISTLELLNHVQVFGTIWEPACGDGAISKVIQKKYPEINVISTDLIDRGFGQGGVDFLQEKKDGVDWIITNPPYSIATDFVKHSLTQASNVAMLLKIQFLEGVERFDFFQKNPPKNIYVFSYRLKINKSGIEQKNSTMFCFAWFVWERGYVGRPTLQWLNKKNI